MQDQKHAPPHAMRAASSELQPHTAHRDVEDARARPIPERGGLRAFQKRQSLLPENFAESRSCMTQEPSGD